MKLAPQLLENYESFLAEGKSFREEVTAIIALHTIDAPAIYNEALTEIYQKVCLSCYQKFWLCAELGKFEESIIEAEKICSTDKNTGQHLMVGTEPHFLDRF